MASSYFKLKMLKNILNTSRSGRKLTKYEHILDLTSAASTAIDAERCRICLNQGILPIYGDQTTNDLSEAVRTFGGVAVNKDDPYPRRLCEECYSLLNGAIIFRKTAKDSDKILRQTSSTVSDAPIMSDNEFTSDIEVCKYLDPDTKKCECKTCQIPYKTLEAYSQHKKSKSHKKIRIQCKICMKLLTEKLYKKHLARHQSASHLICEVCGKLYRKDNLLRHLQLHSNELPFQCSECPYRGRFLDSLKIHVKIHTGDKPFSCNKCELRFITKSNLNRHLLTHEKEKPFKCIECSRSFYIQKDLDVHLRADHAGIKEFYCRICGNKYGMKKALMRHELRVHKREKMAKGRVPLYLQACFQNCQESEGAKGILDVPQ